MKYSSTRKQQQQNATEMDRKLVSCMGAGVVHLVVERIGSSAKHETHWSGCQGSAIGLALMKSREHPSVWTKSLGMC